MKTLYLVLASYLALMIAFYLCCPDVTLSMIMTFFGIMAIVGIYEIITNYHE